MKSLIFLIVVLLLTPTASLKSDETNNAASLDVPLQLGFLFVHYFGEDLLQLEKQAVWVSEYDLIVALFLQRESTRDVKLDQIITWRREGSSWDAITRRCQLSGEIYYIEIPEDIALSDPYVRPFETWLEHPASDQRLNDAEIRELVLLKAISEHLELAAEQVILFRSAGQSPRAIAAAYPAERHIERAAPRVPHRDVGK